MIEEIRVEHTYIVCGYTDMRLGIDSLAALVQGRYKLDPFSNSMFMFCGRRVDRIKVLLWDGDGFILLYKRLERGKYQWPRGTEEAMELTDQQKRWLMEGLTIIQPKAHKPVEGYTVI